MESYVPNAATSHDISYILHLLLANLKIKMHNLVTVACRVPYKFTFTLHCIK